VFLQVQHYISGGSFKGWIHFFYYDKSMTIGLVWVTMLLLITSLKITNGRYRNKTATKDYISFFNTSSRGFIIYYFLLLFYSFVIIRDFDSQHSIPNFIPFHMIIQYAKVHDYEVFMIFFGNLLLFTPFGFYTKVITQKYHFSILMLPVIISSVIELSQLILNNGNCDIDDVILNSFGFYFGIFIKNSVDKIVSRTTGGSEKTLFVWLPYSLFNLSVR
jgi:glycopeptide antibiotics resistance protein